LLKVKPQSKSALVTQAVKPENTVKIVMFINEGIESDATI